MYPQLRKQSSILHPKPIILFLIYLRYDTLRRNSLSIAQYVFNGRSSRTYY